MSIWQSPPAMRARRRLARAIVAAAEHVQSSPRWAWLDHFTLAEQMGGQGRVAIELTRQPLHLEIQLGRTILEIS